MELKMQRNLCGCHHPYARVDLVWASTIGDDDSGSERTLLVDRHISLRAHESDVSAAEHELKVMCYLAGVQLEQGYTQHRHLVRLHGHFQHQGTLHVLTEYCHHGTLMMLMEVDSALHQMRQPRLPHFADVNALRSCTTQICTGVAHLHRHGVAHLDLAIENIFIDEEGVFKVGDFRFAKYVSTFNKPSGLSQPLRDAYAAPETHFGFEIDLLKADAWSVGVILFMLWTRQIPFEETTHDDPKFVALRVAGLRAFLHQLNSAKHPYVVPEDVLLVLEGFLSCDPKDRKTVIESLELHPWLCGDHDRIAPAPDSTSASTAADPAPVSSPIEQFSV
ncbi:TPA: hypothetical protein N0F65_006205 [Lagenidium giganteum]|uniref:Protein kinase domain-containing protein n=1 Tax=Lagenidium giganteum TaxID=4803 RepID=A0AAV2ZCJ3_9STRA|nr:TPA: hypothetical protein N0F65_006205 [Lagenidium giganteum]